jgi:hypothetical protein
MPNTKEIKLEMVGWEITATLNLLNNQNIGRAPLKALKAMMELIDAFKAVEFDPKDPKPFEMVFDPVQWEYFYKVVTHKSVTFAINEETLAFLEKVEAING